MEIISEHAHFGGTIKIVKHTSESLSCEMVFSLFLPKEAETGRVPLLTYLSGLTCTHDNFTTKAGAYGYAAKHGVAILAPDTSPRGDDVPDDKDSYDFGKGAGFYINATRQPWAKHYHMEDYITCELNRFVCKNFSIDPARQSVCGHSMGGHGALTLYLKYPNIYRAASAFSPITAPSQVPWGQKAFQGYLGEDKTEWLKHDATALMDQAGDRSEAAEILIDQGLGDQFLEQELKPELFKAACEKSGQKLKLRQHAAYDHSYYFISTFIEDHITHHAALLKA